MTTPKQSNLELARQIIAAQNRQIADLQSRLRVATENLHNARASRERWKRRAIGCGMNGHKTKGTP